MSGTRRGTHPTGEAQRHTRLQGGVRVVVSLNGFNGACGVRQKKNKNDKRGRDVGASKK